MDYSSGFEFLKATLHSSGVLEVALNRPQKHNAITFKAALQFKRLTQLVEEDGSVRVILLIGNGKHFCSGLDLSEAATLSTIFTPEDPARGGIKFAKVLRSHQESFHSLQTCRVPVVIGIHGYCIGGGVDLTSTGDIVIASDESLFGIQEINLGMAADWGTIQRLGKKAKNHMLLRELCYTARRFGSEEAKELGLVHTVVKGKKEEVYKAARQLAETIASKSPVGIYANKEALNYILDHSMSDGLFQIRLANGLYLNSPDVMKAAMAKMQKEKAIFPKL